MKFNDSLIHTVELKDESNATPVITDIINTYYDLGKVIEISRVPMGDTNFNYFVTLEKDGVQKKYFGQLYSVSKPLGNVKFELALRKYYMDNTNSDMKCALSNLTKDGGYAVKCDLGEGRERYFCLHDFLEGNSKHRDTWAYGKMTPELIKACAKGTAYYHAGAYGYEPPAECGVEDYTFADELELYKKTFTEDFAQCRREYDDPYFDYFGVYQGRLMEILERCTKTYLEVKDEIPHCMCHMDTSPQNYLFNDDMEPVGICDLDWSKMRPRLFDICWFMYEGLCALNLKERTLELKLEDIVMYLNVYDEAIEAMNNPKLGKLTRKEREVLLDIYQLVAINGGFYNIWDLILCKNPFNTYEFNIHWGEWTRLSMELIEENMDVYKKAILGE